MHKKVKGYMDTIVAKGNTEDMRKVEHCFMKLFCKAEEHCPEEAEEVAWHLRDIAEGPSLTAEEADCWVKNMVPAHRWTKEETDSIRNAHRINEVTDVDFYAIMNKKYSDNQAEIGDPIECLDKYVAATKEWILDTDAKPHKVYNYYKYIVAK